MGLVDLIELDIDTPANLPNIGIYKFGLHLIQILFAFLTFCILIPIISIERHYNVSILDKNQRMELYNKLHSLGLKSTCTKLYFGGYSYQYVCLYRIGSFSMVKVQKSSSYRKKFLSSTPYSCHI